MSNYQTLQFYYRTINFCLTVINQEWPLFKQIVVQEKLQLKSLLTSLVLLAL